MNEPRGKRSVKSSAAWTEGVRREVTLVGGMSYGVCCDIGSRSPGLFEFGGTTFGVLGSRGDPLLRRRPLAGFGLRGSESAVEFRVAERD
ncbi:MAG: hypothetical protein HY791_40430 [Deltaproteobacteria bacterium]|nr:hypothetical protein [Deltaproteobacteria bacterium]